ncbi:MAG: HPr family phosphocarrier protein [Lachnospiraceae bacterium]|nr:HPr family phosphocarrier protein [Lachnospiraceae bacterium]
MITRTVKVVNPSGLHIRPAGVFCQKAMDFETTRINFHYGKNNEASAKSILSILGAGIRQNDEIELICDGPDEEQAMDELCSLFEDGFGEI